MARPALRTTVPLVVLAALLVGAAALVAAARVDTVVLRVDDEVRTLRTTARTVEAVLERAEVALRPGDVVDPPADTPVDGDLVVEVHRAFDVEVRVRGGATRRVRAPFTDVREVLVAAELTDPAMRTDPPPHRPVHPGDVVRVFTPIEVRITVDGLQRTVTTAAADVAGALADAGVNLGADDLVTPTPGTSLVGPAHIVVRRVTTTEQDVEVVIPREVIEQPTDVLRVGIREPITAGEDGLRRDTYRLTLIDGREASRELVASVVLAEPVTREERVGTFEPPPPTAPGARELHLTFDDGPAPPYTEQLLDLLAEYDAQAVFFVVGASVARHPDIAARIADEGHRIGNHTWSHPNLTRLPRGSFDAQLSRTQQAVANATGSSPVCFRPPYGASDATRRAWAGALGLTEVRWDVDPYDWRRPGAQVITDRVIADAESGSVVLLHDGVDNRAQTVEAVAELLAYYDARGYHFTAAPGC